MDADELARVFQGRFGLHVEHHMSEYVLRRLEQFKAATLPTTEIPVIGVDARTGIAVRRLMPLNSPGVLQG